MQECWSVWIDEEKKIITKEESPDSVQVFFENREEGIKYIAKLSHWGIIRTPI